MLPSVDDMPVTVPPLQRGDSWELGAVLDIDGVWPRLERHAGQTFHTITELAFTYRVPAEYPGRPRPLQRPSSRTSAQRSGFGP